eukprot:CAMPEP_0168388076 /NCGR_PEP_ID=MMETSP0228-20121227/16269_1 /TAXON_ID=133427 /ORGANISM="Protoceratium reticulatum, Strain CCCM 535 (=CCMP 1889)" /LENGTH=61 /DNA_ID=CAMNT_0008401321 /DNA_START=62 /DNA_END=247 /DNA_ORIENTATION=+
MRLLRVALVPLVAFVLLRSLTPRAYRRSAAARGRNAASRHAAIRLRPAMAWGAGEGKVNYG